MNLRGALDAALVAALTGLVLAATYGLLYYPEQGVMVADSQPEGTGDKKEVEFGRGDWNWRYNSTINAGAQYPFVVLREGYRPLKRTEGDVLVGWHYVLLNVSNNENTAHIDYRLKDIDGFQIAQSAGREEIAPETIGTVRGTMLVSETDWQRVTKQEWGIRTSADATSAGDDTAARVERAANLMKEKEITPYWYKEYLAYVEQRWAAIFPKLRIMKEVLGIESPKGRPILHDKLGFNDGGIPTWSAIRAKPAYQDLSEEDKQTLKEWLGLQADYGSYDPEKGKESFEFSPRFPD